ncbi:hypothetical protein CC1G_05019 [Coprinopsis cinerea okayama7|uniref:Acetyl-CoA synthetase-like protein n=1 Tax=Coprinopsis cinerea (strain Okayama-7 / 130 / ATCC MYA-4618 / FGSC 9003) TaxID=240176 RepID=A8NSJ5_COPC7|nr:hypothetical protein CC1G_05019 [Coprinopsis cinerea okayama7\|eukprot:XP_001836026.2 hypothetical protein CC1G_05019 [Coprinopsis cinerea okayama7\
MQDGGKGFETLKFEATPFMPRPASESLASTLQYIYGIGSEDVVLIASPNHVDYPVVIWAVHQIGGIVTCTNPQFTAEELSYQIGICKPSLIVVHSGNLKAMLIASSMAGLASNGRVVLMDDAEPFECDNRTAPPIFPTLSGLVHEGAARSAPLVPYTMQQGEAKDKVAFFCWSSGTTGNPKAVAISHYAIMCNIIQMAVHNGLRGHPDQMGSPRSWHPGDIALGDVAGLVIALHLSLFSAMSVVVIPKYELRSMVASIQQYSISHLLLVPPQAIALSKHSFLSDRSVDSHVKYILIGAAPVSPHVQQSLVKLFPRAQIGQAYGLTEMTTTVALVSSCQRRGPLGSIKARVLKSDGRLAAHGERGELFVKGPSNALCYYKNPRATRETFFDGWVRTGDEVAISEDNEVYVYDRVKVAPAELEGCLLGHPFVDDACVVGVPHPLMGEIPLAYVVPSPSIADWTNDDQFYSTISEDISKYVATRKAGYKHLRGGIRFIESIPVRDAVMGLPEKSKWEDSEKNIEGQSQFQPTNGVRQIRVSAVMMLTLVPS